MNEQVLDVYAKWAEERDEFLPRVELADKQYMIQPDRVRIDTPWDAITLYAFTLGQGLCVVVDDAHGCFILGTMSGKFHALRKIDGQFMHML